MQARHIRTTCSPPTNTCFTGSIQTVEKFKVSEFSTVIEFTWEPVGKRGVLIPASIVLEVQPDIRVEETFVKIELDGVVVSRQRRLHPTAARCN